MNQKKRAMSGSKYIEDPDIIEGYLRDASRYMARQPNCFVRNLQKMLPRYKSGAQNTMFSTVSMSKSTTELYSEWWRRFFQWRYFNTIHSISEVDAMLGAYRYVQSQQLCFHQIQHREMSVQSEERYLVMLQGHVILFLFYPFMGGCGGRVFPTGEICVVDRKTKIPSEWPEITWRVPVCENGCIRTL